MCGCVEKEGERKIACVCVRERERKVIKERREIKVLVIVKRDCRII